LLNSYRVLVPALRTLAQLIQSAFTGKSTRQTRLASPVPPVGQQAQRIEAPSGGFPGRIDDQRPLLGIGRSDELPQRVERASLGLPPGELAQRVVAVVGRRALSQFVV